MPYSTTTIDEFAVGYDFQKEWIERRGLFLMIAFYLGGVSGGLYLASLQQHFLPGAIVAWLTAMLLKFPAHFLFLGRPLRFWRLVWKPETSWVSRLMISEIMFAIFPALQIISWLKESYPVLGTWLSWLPWTAYNPIVLAAAAFSAFAMVALTGFVIAGAAGIPFWNTPLLPPLFIVAALWGGVSILEATRSFLPQLALDPDMLSSIGLWLGMTAVLLVFTYLVVNYHSSVAAKEAVVFLSAGRLSAVFYGGVAALGIVIPLAVLLLAYLRAVPASLVAVGGISELAGSFVLRYCILKAGIYPPVA